MNKYLMGERTQDYAYRITSTTAVHSLPISWHLILQNCKYMNISESNVFLSIEISVYITFRAKIIYTEIIISGKLYCMHIRVIYQKRKNNKKLVVAVSFKKLKKEYILPWFNNCKCIIVFCSVLSIHLLSHAVLCFLLATHHFRFSNRCYLGIVPLFIFLWFFTYFELFILKLRSI